MTGARNSTRLNYVPMGPWSAQAWREICNFAWSAPYRASSLTHLLLALAAAHPLLAPFPAHLAPLLPCTRAPLHRITARGRRVPLKKFPTSVRGWSPSPRNCEFRTGPVVPERPSRRRLGGTSRTPGSSRTRFASRGSSRPTAGSRSRDRSRSTGRIGDRPASSR